ncbi:hypothetical protein OG936_31570 [Streptomyces sp. NBC_00846]|nr:hypothetical protein OG936_31570 [Streptomyces sp. NBC_00846]
MTALPLRRPDLVRHVRPVGPDCATVRAPRNVEAGLRTELAG